MPRDGSDTRVTVRVKTMLQPALLAKSARTRVSTTTRSDGQKEGIQEEDDSDSVGNQIRRQEARHSPCQIKETTEKEVDLSLNLDKDIKEIRLSEETSDKEVVGKEPEVIRLWAEAVKKDPEYRKIWRAVKD